MSFLTYPPSLDGFGLGPVYDAQIVLPDDCLVGLFSLNFQSKLAARARSLPRL